MPTIDTYVKANVGLYDDYMRVGKMALEGYNLRGARDAYFHAHVAAGRVVRALSSDSGGPVGKALSKWLDAETNTELVWKGLAAVVEEYVRLKVYDNDDTPARVVRSSVATKRVVKTVAGARVVGTRKPANASARKPVVDPIRRVTKGLPSAKRGGK